MVVKNMRVLFDRSGRPAISFDQRTDWFLGIGVTYRQSDEDVIFSKGKADFGLANSKPLKNDRITNSRAVSIVKLLADLPVTIYENPCAQNSAGIPFENLCDVAVGPVHAIEFI